MQMVDFREYNSKRAKVLLVIIALGFIACVGRLGWLQLFKSAELTMLAENNKKFLRELQSPRGSIFDREGRELAVSLITLSLYVDPLAMDDSRAYTKENEKRDPRKLAAGLLAPILNKTEQDLYEIFNKDGHFVWLERTMDKERTDKIQELLRENKINGFGFIKESKRYYPMGKLGAHVLGFVGTDDRGLSGMEMALDSVLKSAVEQQYIETDITGTPIFSSVLESNKAKEMASVYLTIDTNIQFITEKALEKVVKDTNAKSAAALVMDLQTGEILAMTSFPTFDPNNFSDYSQDSWTNRTISLNYEPGSTLKPVIAAAAINEKVIQPENEVFDEGQITVNERTIKNSEDRKYGKTTFNNVITYSINTVMVEVALNLGAERMNKYAQSFGLGSGTGIELPGEEEGILFKTHEMRLVDVASMSIGQGVAVTPIQLIRAVASIANDGYLVQPYIIQKIVQSDGTVIRQGGNNPTKQIISTETSRKVLAMMENVVLYGGGQLAKIPGYRIAGKTGTAQKLKSGGGYSENEYIASFIGVAPVENPRFIVLVLVDAPRNIYYGSQIAAPVFREIMQEVLLDSGIEPTIKKELPVHQVKAGSKGNGQVGTVKTVIPEGHIMVPDLSGNTMRACAQKLEQGGLAFMPKGSGVAVKQQPAAFTVVPKKTEITVWFQ